MTNKHDVHIPRTVPDTSLHLYIADNCVASLRATQKSPCIVLEERSVKERERWHVIEIEVINCLLFLLNPNPMKKIKVKKKGYDKLYATAPQMDLQHA